MSNITGTIRARATVEAATGATIYNVPVTLANTEYSQALSSGTKSFIIKNRNDGLLKISFSAGTSGSNFVTLPPGCSLPSEGLNFSGTVYFQSTKPTQVVEILEWV